MRRIGIFGGSFNPIHSGHLLAMDVFRRELFLDSLLVIPAGIPPHKQLAENSPEADVRFRLTAAAASELPWTEVLDLELKRKGKSYSIDTVMELHRLYPGDRLFLLMGTDMFLSFEQWYRFEELLKLCELGVICRYDADEQSNREIQTLAASFSDKYGAKIHIIKSEHIELSSTQVRRMLFFGCGEQYLPQPIRPMIRENGYYAAKNCKALSLDELTRRVAMLYDPKRFTHAVGCAQTAVTLARRYGADADNAARAGILHDITKALRGKDQFALCERFGIPCLKQCVPDVLHGYTAAAAAREIFGENEDVCSAIYWHTTGHGNMTILEKILYLADYMEPNRDFEEVHTLRDLAENDLDKALLYGLELSIRDLTRRGKIIDPNSAEAYEFLKSERI